MKYSTQEIAASYLTRHIVVLDTESTGLDENSEIIEVGLVGKDGQVLIDSLCMPIRPIPEEVTAINHITNEMVMEDNTGWYELREELEKYKDAVFVIYNAVFDVRMIEQTEKFHHYVEGITERQTDLDFIGFNSMDLMELANRHFHQYLEWDKKKSCFKRLSLKKCCEIAGIEYPDDAHRAAPDCQVTLQLLQFIAEDVPVAEDELVIDVATCSKCGDRLGHEEDAGDVCHFCNEGWVPSDSSDRDVACSAG